MNLKLLSLLTYSVLFGCTAVHGNLLVHPPSLLTVGLAGFAMIGGAAEAVHATTGVADAHEYLRTRHTKQLSKDDFHQVTQAIAEARMLQDEIVFGPPDTPESPCITLRAGSRPDDGWVEFPSSDDGSIPVNLLFNFNFYGTPWTRVYINNNGNLSFGAPYSAFSAFGFPSTSYQMIAPFWADIDTRDDANPMIDRVWYKAVASNMFIVAWDQVGFYSHHTYLRNTFQVLISDGTVSTFGSGNNACFCYADMQWTTGDASSGASGFGGSPATVGINKGDNVKYFQVGRFNQPGTSYDGPYSANDGVDYLDFKSFCFNAANSDNTSPIYNGPTTLALDQCQMLDTTVSFLSPELSQMTNVVVDNSLAPGLTSTITAGNTATVQIQWSPSTDGTYSVTLTATDNGSPIETSVQVITITVSGCNSNHPPIAICQNVVKSADNSNCQAAVVISEIANGSFDPDGDALTFSISPPSPYSLGVTPVTLTVIDGSESNNCTATVTVEDNANPTAICQDIVVPLTGGMATIAASAIDGGSSDACGIDSLSLDMDTFDCPDIGNNTITLSVTDNSGNEANCTAVVTVEDSALDPELIDCGNVSILSSCDIPYTFMPTYKAPNGCPVIITPIVSNKCTACNKDGNIFERDSDMCQVEIGDNVTISEVAGDDDFVQVFFNVSDSTSTITATCTFCIDKEPSAHDASKSTKGCEKVTKGSRTRALARTRKEPYTHPSEQEGKNLRGLKSTKGTSFTCPSNWTASTSSPECPIPE